MNDRVNFRDLVQYGLRTQQKPVEEAAEDIAEMESSRGWKLLRYGASCRSLELSKRLITLSPYDDPQRIVEVQAEIRALEFIINGFSDSMDELYSSYMAEKQKKDTDNKDDENNPYDDLEPGIDI